MSKRLLYITNGNGNWAFLLVIVLFTGCNTYKTHPFFGDIANRYISFEHNGIQRQYALHVPSGVRENAPLLISMHGYTDDAIRHRNYTDLNDVADKNGFIVAYPRGTKDKYGKRFFNMGYYFHQEETVDDVGFIVSLTEYLQEKYKIDKSRTFTAGFSNGGDMSYMLACQRPDLFKGLVSVGGLMLEDFKKDCEFQHPIPILEIRGETDSITLYNGDITNRTGWGIYPPIEETMDFWQKRNKCQTVERDTIFNPNPKKNQHIQITKYKNCSENREVWLYKITDYPHKWPQGWDRLFFNASEEIWNFLGQY